MLADNLDTYQTVAEKATVRVAQYKYRKRRGLDLLCTLTIGTDIDSETWNLYIVRMVLNLDLSFVIIVLVVLVVISVIVLFV